MRAKFAHGIAGETVKHVCVASQSYVTRRERCIADEINVNTRLGHCRLKVFTEDVDGVGWPLNQRGTRLVSTVDGLTLAYRVHAAKRRLWSIWVEAPVPVDV